MYAACMHVDIHMIYLYILCAHIIFTVSGYTLRYQYNIYYTIYLMFIFLYQQQARVYTYMLYP
jgi:hypothetical protein